MPLRSTLAALLTLFGSFPVRIGLMIVAFLLLCVIHGRINAAEDPGVTELKSTIKRLEERAAELKDTNLSAYSVLTSAVKDLRKYTEDGDADGSKLMVQLLSPQNLKKLFKAPTRVDKKTGEVSIGYDWSDAAQIQDWTVGASTPEIRKGALNVTSLDKLTHKGMWKGNVTITGRLSMANRLGTHLMASNGYSVTGITYNAWIIQLQKDGTKVAEDTFDHSGSDSETGMFVPFTWALQPDRTVLKFLKSTAGTSLSGPFLGQVSLCGGQGGNAFSGVIITGMLDSNWIKQALGLGAQ